LEIIEEKSTELVGFHILKITKDNALFTNTPQFFQHSGTPKKIFSSFLFGGHLRFGFGGQRAFYGVGDSCP
jgi:hypothetical protein